MDTAVLESRLNKTPDATDTHFKRGNRRRRATFVVITHSIETREMLQHTEKQLERYKEQCYDQSS